MEQLQRKTFIPRGINRSNPVSQPEDGHCHEIVNMRYKDNAWRRVMEKSKISIVAPTPSLLEYDLLKRHPLLANNFFIGVKNSKLYQIDISEERESLLKDYTGQEIEDIVFFGRLMIVSISNNKDIFKLDLEDNFFIEMPDIPEGSHLISDSGDPEQSIELEALSAGNEAQIAKINKLLYDDKEVGKFEGHCFFRFAWRLWDNSLIHHSAVHYYHVGINDGLMRFDTLLSDPVVVDKYRTARPRVRHSFNADELDALEQYKDIITGLMLFMTDPVSTYDIADELDGWVNTVGNLYVPAITDRIGDILKDVKGFYKIHEMSLSELIKSVPMDDGLYLTDIEIDVGNVVNIESNERMPLDSYTNHKIKGNITYDYNSMLHLGNVKTILSDPKNIGKFAPAFGVITNPLDELVYGADMQIHPDLFGEGGETPENVRVYVEESGTLTTELASDYKFVFNENESDPAGCYDTTTGVYTVKENNSGIYAIDFSAIFSTNISGWTVIEVKRNGALQKQFKFQTQQLTTQVAFSYILPLSSTNGITIHGYGTTYRDDQIIGGLTNAGNPSTLTINRMNSLAQINYNPVIQVELDTEEGTKIVTKEYEAAASFLNGITGYYNSDNINYYLMFKEVVSYPDLRARKIRIALKSNTTDAYYLLKTYDLVQHPYLDFAYSKPVLLADKNYYYVPQKILIPQQLYQFVPDTENRIITDKNRVQVSEINNPWVYPAINSYRIGTSSNEVLKIATMSEPMSVGQYGESPLMVFTSQGIFNLMQGQQGILYAAINRFNLDVLLQKDALVELGGAIVYATSKGLFVLAGSQREEISKAIEGSVAGVTGRIDHWKLPVKTIGEADYYISDHFSDADFITYMQDALLAYDNKEMEIFAIKPEANYSYVYQIETKMWHKISESYRKLIRRADNSFEALGDDGLLYKLSEEQTEGMRDVGILTRPMLFTDSNLKKVERMAARFINENSGGDTTVNLYVSLDGWSFVWLAGVLVSKQQMDLSNLIIKRTHTSARYFMVSMGLTASVRFELTGFELDVLYRHQQKLR